MTPKFQKLGIHKGLPVSVKPVPEQERQSRFPDSGSEVITIGPTEDGGFNTIEGRVLKVGYGLEILGGVDGITAQVGGTTHQTQTVSITFLVAGDNATGSLRASRTFIASEVFDGAILPGRFEEIHVRWVSSNGETPAGPLTVRVFHQPLRIVPTMPPRPLGLPVLDFFDGALFAHVGTDLAHMLYNDADPQVLLHRDANPLVGKGIGGDFRMGQHFSLKRLLVGRVWFPTPVATAQYRVHIDAEASDGTFKPWAHFTAVDRPDATVATWDSADGQLVSFGHMHATKDEGSITGALHVPAKIRIRSATNTAAQGVLGNCAIWLSFIGG